MSGGEGERTARIGPRLLVLLALSVLALVSIPALVARADVNDTTLVSRADGVTGAAANGNSGPGVAVSADGRFVAFESRSTNLGSDLVDPQQQPVEQIYLRDTQTGATTLVSRAADGLPGDGDSANPAVSPDGGYVAFESAATNLSAEDDDSVTDVFLYEVATGVTTLVSRAADGSTANGGSYAPAVSENGTFVAFESDADNVSNEDVDSVRNVFLRDMVAGTNTLVSRAKGLNGAAGDGDSFDPSISKDGRRIAFASNADNIFDDDRDVFTNVYVYEPQFKLLTHVSRTSTTGTLSDPANGNSTEPVISDGGGFVAFTSTATNLAPGAGPVSNVYVRDLSARSTELASRADSAGGAPGTGASSAPSISGDGLQVAFASEADNLNPVDDDSVSNVFVRNVAYSTTSLVSRANGTTGAPAAGGGSFSPAISRAGDYVAFTSDADNLSADDDDTFTNVFVRQLPFVPPPPDVPPDLGSNDHSGHTGDQHAGHTADEHAGHTAADHAGHTTATGGPAQTLFGPLVQDVDTLFVLAQVHADARLVVTATVNLPGRGRAATLYRFKSFKRAAPAHRVFRVRLKLSKKKLRAVKRALKHRKRLRAVIVLKAQAAAGGPWSTSTLRVRLRD
jgi:Tol biopolymer transport system component